MLQNDVGTRAIIITALGNVLLNDILFEYS